MAKRRFISLLPNWNQTDDLTNFFGSTVDEVFQPGVSEPVSGYVGRKPSFFNAATDFYVPEPTASRAAYQLEAGMISKNADGTITNALSYPDLIGYLDTEGANVTNHQRLFETDYYAWAPPINIDMIVNYRDYCWFGNNTSTSTYVDDLAAVTLTLTVPMLTYTGDGTTTTFALPASINAVPSGQEAPAVFVNNIPVLFTVSGNNVILNSAPTNGSTVLVCRTPDLASIIAGNATVDVSDINTNGVQTLTSTMRIKIIDALHAIGAWDVQPWDYNLWDYSGTNLYIVDGVGTSIRLTPDYYMVRGLEAQYVTIDRSSSTFNGWSAHNNWMHRDAFKWSGLSFPERQGVRPIIEFLRDLNMWPNQTWSESTDPLFMLYDADNVALNDPGRYPASTFQGSRIFGYATGVAPLDPVLHRSLSFDSNGYPIFQNDVVAVRYTYNNGTPITGLYCYGFTNDTFSSLWHPAAATTTQGVTNGFFNIPLNLQANPLSDDVSTISRSTWVDHFSAIIGNQTGLVGHPLGDNNYRDTLRDLSLGITILQHRAPMLKLMLMAQDTDFDIPAAIRYVDQEYNRFRNKFVRKLADMSNRGTLSTVDPTVDPDTWVVTALNDLKKDKTNKFPFALSTMAGGQYFIPPTPTALGILPAAVPAMVTDSTYATSVNMILGHDGSMTPAFNDWRDNVMLALEQRIYNNLPTQFQTEARPGFDIQQWIGGRFFAPYNGYSRSEVSQILAPMFELWAQNNRFDYRTNKFYDPGNPFTWNFSGVKDIFGNVLPGNWRAIYRYYYGTDAPNLRPWEMLGFVSEPSWWQTTYGSAPYTKSNTALWHDLENGIIAGGPRAGTDDDYARPGLSNLIPVDNSGKLLDPVATGIVNINLPLAVATRSWQAGDQGPAENLWINSPSYRFALAAAAFLMKPARFVEECWDVLNIGYVGVQWLELSNLERPQNSEQYVHGEIKPDGTTSVVTGFQQWISDNIVATGQTVSGFGTAIRGLDVRLLHQMAGFVSSDDIKAVADNFGLLPSEDVNVVLYESPATDTEVYSGVILEWTGAAWRVIGYDARTPSFTVIPPDVNGPKGIISLAGADEPSIVQWRPNTYYPINVLAIYQNSVFQCLRSHTSGPRFENNFWQTRPDLSTSMIRAPRVITYARGLNTTQTVPYGTEFHSYQDVADFLLGWERWLVSRGWVFDALDPDGQILDWKLSVREFLTWAQIQWQPGNFIALSPGMAGLKFITANGTILNVEDTITGYFGLLDRSGQPIRKRDVSINRLDGQITIAASKADIFAARLEIAEIEHALVFSNVTIFNDDVYLPLFDMRQTRLKLICNRSTDWAGRLDAPGYVIIGNQIKSNFDKAANDVRLMFDMELADVKELRDYARHVINFQERDYLDNLLLSDLEQFEFYQGMIQQKGAPGVFEKLMRSQRVSGNANSQFLEEWAFRLGRFGAPLDPFITFQVTQTDTRDDPQLVRFQSMSNAPLDWIIMPMSDSRWLDKPAASSFFTLHTTYTNPLLPTAGPVRLSDVVNTAFHITDVPAIYTQQFDNGFIPFAAGTRTWVYERADGSYTVLESFETGATPNTIQKVLTKAEDNTIVNSRIVFENTMTLTTADIGNYLVIDGQSKSSPELQGVQKITAVNVGSNYVEVAIKGTHGFDFTTDQADAPFVRVLREVRFADLTALSAATYAFKNGDLAWIDNYANNLWGVVQYNGSTWVQVRSQPHRVDPTTISETIIYSEGVNIVGTQMFVNEPIVDDVDVIDPISGLLAGICDREIDFKTEYDPARYNSGAVVAAANPWGENQVGRVWWNLSTVKFLDPYTDTLGASADRDLAELTYRSAYWTHVAPNSSVDVYEWTRSLQSPSAYTADIKNTGAVYNADAPSWVETLEYDPNTGIVSTIYYFWVKGLTTVPDVGFRHTDISTVARGIESPSSLDIAWMSPIAGTTMIYSGVLQFLNDSTTVMKVRLTLDSDNPGRHDEWILMRPTDETSLPPDYLWEKLRDSLATFNQNLKTLPFPSLAPTRNTGVTVMQNMFNIDSAQGTRMGLMDAREAFVGSINNIFSATPITIDRNAYIPTIFRSTVINEYLLWTQPDASYPFEKPPSNEWDVQVYTLDHRNQLVARSDFLAAVSSGTTIRVLLNGTGQPIPNQSWSIWNFNPISAAAVIAANPSLDEGLALLQNADQVFDLARSYEWSVDSMAARNALVTPLPTIAVGDRVLVTSDSSTYGFWSIWKYLPSDSHADAYGFVVWRVQSYRTDDFIEYVDWYATGYSASNPPIVSYPTINARNVAEASHPSNTFVKVDDDGTGKWIWSVLVTVEGLNGPINIPEVNDNDSDQIPDGDVDDQISTTWQTVAIQDGTLALSSNFYDPTRVVHGVNTISVTDINNRDGSWELYILGQALRFTGILLDSEINQCWFDMVNFCHSQQADVDWAFKTSFMTIAGYNVPLEQTPFLLPDQTNNIISYVDEVKPYHVKIREFSTQYVTDVDDANTTATDFDKPVYFDPLLDAYRVLNLSTDGSILSTKPWVYWYDNYQLTNTPVRGLDITLAFDRVAGANSLDTWDSAPWDTRPWDGAGEEDQGYVYAHTTVRTSLIAPAQTIAVDDIRFMASVYSNGVLTKVTTISPLTINLGSNTYQIGTVTADTNNVSTTPHGVSGTLTTVSGNFTTSDATSGNVVESVIKIPLAAQRILTSYVPSTGMPPKDLTLLLNLDMRAATIVYATTVAVSAGATVLTFADTTAISIGQPLYGANIVKGTVVADVTSTTVTLSEATVGQIPAGTSITFTLPSWLDGFILQTFEAPVSDFDIVPFDTDPFDTTTTIYNTTYDGSTLTPPTLNVEINPAQTSRPDGLGFHAPYYTESHPEERLPVALDDGLQMVITALADAGGPPQIIRSFDVSNLGTSTATLFFGLIAQAKTGVMVFRDGIRAILDTDFTVDHLGRTVTVNITGVKIVSIHAFGFGGTSPVNDQHFIGFSSNPIVLDNASTLSNVAVVQDGTTLDSSAYTVSGTDVTITSAPSAGTDVAVVVYDNGVSTASIMTTQTLTYNLSQQWTLSPHDTDTVPEHAGTIVEVNGERIAPPTTFYGTFALDKPWMYVPIAPDNTMTITVYVDGVLYTTAIPFCTSTSPSSTYPFDVVVPSGQTPPTNIAGQFVFFENFMIALDPTFVSNDVAIVMTSGSLQSDYTVSNGVLTISKSLSSGDKVVATTFSNASSMGLKTVVYTVGAVPTYFVPLPFAKDYALVAMDGLELSPDLDYEITEQTFGWDTFAWDAVPWDISDSYGVLDIYHPTSGKIVATMATAQAAREEMQWRVSTNTPAFLRMPPVLVNGQQISGLPTHGTQTEKPLYNASFEYTRVSPYMAGSLAQILAPTDTQMVVNLFLADLSSKLKEPNPLPQPDGNIPGCVWIGSERIEYFGYSRTNDVVTLSGLRRGTRGTTIAEQRVVAVGTGNGSSQTYHLDATNGTGTVEVTVNGLPFTSFTTTLVGNDMQVTLTAPNGQYVTASMTIGFSYPAGSSVYNGLEVFSDGVPTGVNAGNREIYPNHQIIAG